LVYGEERGDGGSDVGAAFGFGLEEELRCVDCYQDDSC